MKKRYWGKTKYGIQFDSEAREWIGINDLDRATWKSTYPNLDVVHELQVMADWLVSHPSKGCRKQNMRAFIAGWLNREDRKSGDRPTTQNCQRQRPEAGGRRRAREDRQYD